MKKKTLWSITMKKKTLLILPILILFAACAVQANGPDADEDEPEIPGITKVERGTKIDDIKSDDFDMKKVTIEGDVMKIDVSYAGGKADHDFTLYWNQMVAESYPGQTTINLKHDANGDNAEALITKTLKFDISTINKPMIITVRTDHGDKGTVRYGKR